MKILKMIFVCTIAMLLQEPSLIAVGNFHACALTEAGLRCWGSDLFGQLEVPKNLSDD